MQTKESAQQLLPHLNEGAQRGQFMFTEAEKAWELLYKFGSRS